MVKVDGGLDGFGGGGAPIFPSNMQEGGNIYFCRWSMVEKPS